MQPQLVTRFVQLMCSQSFTPCRGDTATRPVLWLTGSVSALAESLPQWAATRLNLSSTLPRNESFEENSTAHFLSAAKHGAHECGPGSTVDLDWPKVDPEVLEQEPPETWGHDLQMSNAEETELGLIMPVQVYPMFETAIRAARGVSPEQHLADVGRMWSAFSAVAEQNPNAWLRQSLSPSEITTPSESNRMVGYPYTKAMNSNNDVDMAAAIIICSVEHAESLGVPRDQWVFPLSGTDCHEHPFITDRDNFSQTPAVELGGRQALELASLDIDDIAHLDLYSCFPSAVQLGARSLGIDPYSESRPLTQTGGLSFAGGPWNEYVMHSIARWSRPSATNQDLRTCGPTAGS